MVLKKFYNATTTKLNGAIQVCNNSFRIANDVYEKMGEPKFVEIWYDEDDKSLVLFPAESGVRVRNKSRNGNPPYWIFCNNPLKKRLGWLITGMKLQYRGTVKLEGEIGYLFRED